MPSDNTDDTLIDAKEAARKLGVSTATIYRLLRAGKLHGFAVGKRRKIYLQSVLRWQEENAFAPPPPPAPQNGAAGRRKKKRP